MCIATENYLSNSQFLHLSKKLQCIFAGRICWPGMDIAESFHLSRNKFNHYRALFSLFQKKIYWKMPPPHFWRKFYGGKFNFDDNWASHKVRTLLAYPGLAYLSFSYVWNIKKHITTKHYQNIVLVFKNSPDFVCKSENFQKPFNTFF